jgi:hypothetical protein
VRAGRAANSRSLPIDHQVLVAVLTCHHLINFYQFADTL